MSRHFRDTSETLPRHFLVLSPCAPLEAYVLCRRAVRADCLLHPSEELELLSVHLEQEKQADASLRQQGPPPACVNGASSHPRRCEQADASAKQQHPLERAEATARLASYHDALAAAADAAAAAPPAARRAGSASLRHERSRRYGERYGEVFPLPPPPPPPLRLEQLPWFDAEVFAPALLEGEARDGEALAAVAVNSVSSHRPAVNRPATGRRCRGWQRRTRPRRAASRAKGRWQRWIGCSTGCEQGGV